MCEAATIENVCKEALETDNMTFICLAAGDKMSVFLKNTILGSTVHYVRIISYLYVLYYCNKLDC